MTTFKSDIIESLNIIDDPKCVFEATLYRSGEIGINAEDGENGVAITYSLDQIRTIVATLGHLLYVADNYEDDDED